MIDEQLLLKISDFGLAKGVNSSNCFQTENNLKLLPVRWMSPEVLTTGTFSAHSDVVGKHLCLWIIFRSTNSINYRKKSVLFQLKFDVCLCFKWSYGVLMWEIFSCGAHPYEDINNSDVRTYVQEGKRLKQPALAGDHM